MATNGSTNGTHPKITLYTNHGCPWAHRAHITLKELGLPYEEVIIDLDRPRDEWYLKVNPRGLVPSIRYSNGVIDEIITESAIVAQFLADSFPSHLLPASNSSPTAPLFRARVAFFVDAWFSKVNSFIFQTVHADTTEAKEEKAEKLVAGIKKEIEPLLADAAPYFNGSDKFTLAEVLIAPFILRLHEQTRDPELLPASLAKNLEALPNFWKWSKKVISQESVTYIWNYDNVVGRQKKRLAAARAAAK